jgi:hypothetical protein
MRTHLDVYTAQDKVVSPLHSHSSLKYNLHANDFPKKIKKINRNNVTSPTSLQKISNKENVIPGKKDALTCVSLKLLVYEALSF